MSMFIKNILNRQTYESLMLNDVNIEQWLEDKCDGDLGGEIPGRYTKDGNPFPFDVENISELIS